MTQSLPGGRFAGGITLLSGLFSRLCLSCRQPSGSGSLCIPCREDPAWLVPVSLSARGGIPTRSLFPDEGAPGRLFRVAKFSGNRHALDLLLDRGDLFGLRPPTASLLLPVPPGRSRLISRDLSVPDILAHRLSSGEIPICLKGLRRTGKSSQKGRTRQARREAFFSPHFSLDPGAFSGLPPRGVVIVDDLLVTGWTARAIVRLLALSGVEVGTIVTLLHRS